MTINKSPQYMQYSIAVSYLRAADCIKRSDFRLQSEYSVYAPLYQNAAYSIEFYFKSWLYNCNVGDKVIKSIGHDLSELHSLCIATGLPLIEGLDNLSKTLSKDHKENLYRYYRDGQSLQFVDWDLNFPVIRQLDFAVDTAVGASAHHGLNPIR